MHVYTVRFVIPTHLVLAGFQFPAARAVQMIEREIPDAEPGELGASIVGISRIGSVTEQLDIVPNQAEIA